MKKKEIILALESYSDDNIVVFRDGDKYIIPNRVIEREDVNSGFCPPIYDEKGKVNVDKIIVVDNDQI